MNAQERENLRRELLELHFGCHPDPEPLEARLREDFELRELWVEVGGHAEVLSAAARAETPTLEFVAPPLDAQSPRVGLADAPRRSPWTRRLAVAASLLFALFVGLPFAQWGEAARTRAQVEGAVLRLAVTGPPSIGTGSPGRFEVATWSTAGEERPAALTWRLFDAEGVELSSHVAESDGSFVVEIPERFGDAAHLEVEARAGEALETVRVALTQHDEPPLVHLTSDKPAYRPGETILARAVVLDRLALEARGGSYLVQIRDAQDTPVANLQVAAEDGVAAVHWAIPEGSAGGAWTLALRDADDAFDVESLELTVRSDYQPPTTRKEIDLDRETYAPGESGVAEITVTRLAGGPAAGATVEGSLVVDGETGWTGVATLDGEGRAVLRFDLPAEVERGDGRFVARVVDGGVVETEIETFVVPTGEVRVAFYPEGGELVAGVANRVYAEVSDPLERPLDARGRVVDGEGRIVARFETLHQGRARFELVPASGATYTLELDSPEGAAIALPAALDEGVVLRGLADSSSPDERLAVSVATPHAGTWLAGVYCRGVQVGQRAFLGGGTEIVEIDVPDDVAGVLRVTIFDEELAPVAERLVHRTSGRELRVEIAPSSAELAPRERQEIAFRVTDETGEPVAAILGVSVYDRAVRDMLGMHRVGLADQAWLAADVEELEDAEEFLANDAESLRNVDLLLGTRGWRRFAWEDPEALVAAHGDDAQRHLVREGIAGVPVHALSADSLQPRLAAAAWDVGLARERALERGWIGLLILAALALAVLLERLVRASIALPAGWRVAWTLGTASLLVLAGRAFVTNPLSGGPGSAYLPISGGRGLVIDAASARRIPSSDVRAFYEELRVSRAEWVALPTPIQSETLLDLDGLDATFAGAGGGLGGDARRSNTFPTPVWFNAPVDAGLFEFAPFAWDLGRRELGAPVNFVGASLEFPELALLEPWSVTGSGAALGTGPSGPSIQVVDGPELRFRSRLSSLNEIYVLDFDTETIALDQLAERLQSAERGWAGDEASIRLLLADEPFGAFESTQGLLTKNVVRDGYFLDANGQLVWGRFQQPRTYTREYAHARSDAAERSDFAETLYWNGLLRTEPDGTATVGFDVSDSVTTWSVAVDLHGASRVGQAEESFDSIQPLVVDATLPVEVSQGDELRIPVAVRAADGELAEALVTAGFAGAAPHFAEDVGLVDGRGRALVPVTITRESAGAPFLVTGAGAGWSDLVQRPLVVVPRGYPHALSQGGLLADVAQLTLHLPDDFVPDSASTTIKVYPSPLAGLDDGTSGMFRQPSGCFEQTSSKNYPNILALRYLRAVGLDSPRLEADALGHLRQGAKMLLGYECPSGGFEWWGNDPGHPALTAYGLLQFDQMAKEPALEFDGSVVERTRAWLLGLIRDDGGFARGKHGHTFGNASEDVVESYLLYALARTGTDRAELGALLDRAAGRVLESDDPYAVAVATCALAAAGHEESARAGRERLAELRAEDGSLTGTTGSITSSGGADLTTETTAFAVLAWLDDEDFRVELEQAVEFLMGRRRGDGTFGATQATVMGLEALVAYAERERTEVRGGAIVVRLDGEEVERFAFGDGHRGAIVLGDLGSHLAPGEHLIELAMEDGSELPYAIDVDWFADRPADSAEAPLAIAVALGADETLEGRTVPLEVRVTNETDEALPMALAVVGLPAGLDVDADVLDDLRDADRFDAWELRGRELCLYWNDVAPEGELAVTVDCTARIPGTTTGPASRVELYYTPEAKRWAPPVTARIVAER